MHKKATNREEKKKAQHLHNNKNIISYKGLCY